MPKFTKKKNPTPAEYGAELRDCLLGELRKSDVSCYEVAKRTGIDKGVLSRFKAGKRPQLSLVAAAQIAEGIGLHLCLHDNRD